MYPLTVPHRYTKFPLLLALCCAILIFGAVCKHSKFAVKMKHTGTIFFLIYILLSYLFLAVLHGFSYSCGEWEPISSGDAQTSCSMFSCCGAWASVVGAGGLSSCGSGALEHRFSRCGAWA